VTSAAGVRSPPTNRRAHIPLNLALLLQITTVELRETILSHSTDTSKRTTYVCRQLALLACSSAIAEFIESVERRG
jgi:hypothetical protein